MMLKILLLVCLGALCTTEACHDLWYNQCTENTDCCSGNCFKGDDNGWQEGVCKPKTGEAPSSAPANKPSSNPSGCHALWYNQCTENSDCCSGFCFKGDDNGWQEGVCKPKK